jgi:hypothetical protein
MTSLTSKSHGKRFTCHKSEDYWLSITCNLTYLLETTIYNV